MSLGDTDELAHRNDRSGYLRALEFADEFVGKVRLRLADLRRKQERTLLIVTTDHGRADSFVDHGRSYPESARSFLFMEGDGVAKKGLVRDAPPRYLRDIAPTVRAMCGLPAGGDSGNGGKLLGEVL